MFKGVGKMNNEEILKRLETKDKNYPKLKKKYPIFAEAFKEILRDIRNEAIQEAQKQSAEEIKDLKRHLEIYGIRIDDLKQQISDVNKIIDDAKRKFIEKIKHCGNLTSKYDYENECYVKDDSHAIIVLEYFTEIFNEELKSSLSKGDAHSKQGKMEFCSNCGKPRTQYHPWVEGDIKLIKENLK